MRVVRWMAAAAGAAALAFGTQAAAVTYVATQLQTADSQDFVFTFAGVEQPLGMATVAFTVRGDFSLNSTVEAFSYAFEGLTGGPFGATAANATVFDGNQTQFTQTLFVSQSDFAARALDSVLTFGVDFSNTVNLPNPGLAFARVSVTYDGAGPVGVVVPEPAIWATMILGFGAVGAVLRRRRTLAGA